MRLAVAVALSTIGGVGLWSIVVALPAVQAEFGTARADASLPYTLTTLGFAAGGVMMGRLADRFGVMWPVLLGTVSLGLGYILSAQAEGITGFAVTYGALIGLFGSCAMFGPLVADTSLWFRRRRGLAVSLCASGNTSPARSGRRCCNGASPIWAGGRPMCWSALPASA
ncbi:MFS transporter [Siccirubricoccus deserti]